MWVGAAGAGWEEGVVTERACASSMIAYIHLFSMNSLHCRSLMPEC